MDASIFDQFDYNDERLRNIINKKYLDLSTEKLMEIEMKLANREISQIFKDNIVINKIKVIYWIEELFKLIDIKLQVPYVMIWNLLNKR